MAFLADVEDTITNFRLRLGLSKLLPKRTQADAITRVTKSIENLARLNIDINLPAHNKAMRQLVRAFNDLRRRQKEA